MNNVNYFQIKSIVLCWCLATGIKVSAKAQKRSESVFLIKAIVYLHTDESRKKNKENLTIEIKTPVTEKLLAHGTYQYTKADAQKVTSKGADYQIELTIDAHGIEKQDCLGYSVTISQNIQIRDMHKFDARVEFYLSDGYVIAAAKDDIELKKDIQKVNFSAF